MTGTSNTSLLLSLFLPYRMVNLATNLSNAYSKIYRTEFDISLPEWRIIASLAEVEQLNAKNIGTVTFMDKSKVSRAVKLLEQKELLVRKKDEQDNRAAYLSLSDKGKDIYAQIVPKALDWEANLISVLSADEYRDLMRILEKLDNQVLRIENQNV